MIAGIKTCICIVILVMILLCHLKTHKNTRPNARLRTALTSNQIAALLMKSDTLKSPGCC